MLQQPFKTYNGGKSGNGTYQQIINFIPKCEIFIDAMVGNGGIVSKINLPEVTVINDYNAGIIDKYDCSGHSGIIKENLHVMDLIAKYDQVASSTFFYFDPPYLKSSRKSQRDLYKFEWSMTDHLKFLSRVLTVKSNCMISHYPCKLYDKTLSSWHSHLFNSTTRHGSALECIYMNYPTPTVLQDYQFLGKDFIDRQRIKRKVQRHLRKLESLPPQERQLIIRSIIDKYGVMVPNDTS